MDTPGTSDGKYVFTYDSRGNRVKKERTVDGQAPVVETDTYNAQDQVASDSWGYDADGNLTKEEKATSVFNAANQKVDTKLTDRTNNTTSTFAGTSQNELIGQVSSKQGSFVYTHGLTDRYGNPQTEKVTHEPLFLRDTNKTAVHMYIGDPDFRPWIW